MNTLPLYLWLNSIKPLLETVSVVLLLGSGVIAARVGRSSGLLLLCIACFLSAIVTPRLHAQWSWSRGWSDKGTVVVFPASAMTASGTAVAFKQPDNTSFKSKVITLVPPEYPIDERTSGHHGAGFFRMIIDPKTGLVTRMVVETSTGFKSLDDSVINAGLQWRWKPATWKEFIFSCTFQDWVSYK